MSPRSQLFLGVVGTIAGAALLFAIGYRISFEAVFGQFRHADWRYLAAALPLGFSMTAGRVARYCLFLPFRAQLTQLYVAFAYMRGVTYILPFRLGEPVSLYMLKRWKLVPSMSAAAPAWALFRFGDVLAQLILLLPALAFILPNEPHATAWLAGIAVLISVGIVLLGTWEHLIEILSRHLVRYTGRLAIIFGELRLGLMKTKSRSRIAWSVAASLLIAVLNVAVSLCALWAVSLPVSLPRGAAIAVIAQAMSTLPFRPPLGIGLQESVWTGLLVLAGVDTEQAFAGALSVRAAQITIIAIESVVATAGLMFKVAATSSPTVRRRLLDFLRFVD